MILNTAAKREIKFGIKSFLSGPKEPKAESRRLSPEEALSVADKIHPGRPFEEVFPHIPPSRPGADKGEDELDEIANDIIKNFALSTNLIFGNSKQSIEVLADRLHERVRGEKWVVDPFVVHHGSLSKDLREDAEATLKSGVPTTALCSSTLEMGIDIGHIRAIGQLDTPWSVSSMVQRLGRSGRRAGEAAIMRMYVREESPHAGSTITDLLYPDLVRAIAMTRLMLAKWLEPFDQNRMHLSTLTHQVLSCLKQTGGMRASDLFKALCQRGPFRSTTQAQFAALLKGLARHGLVEQVPQGEIILGLAGERITSGFDFYAAFQSTEEFVVRCGPEEIGKLPADIVPPIGDHLILAGKRWRVEELLLDQKTALVTLSPGGKAPPFQGAGGEIHTSIIREMKAVLLNEDMPPFIDGNSRILLRAARQTAQKVGLAKSDIIVGKKNIQWFPWIGSRGLLTLALLAKSSGIGAETDRLSITYHVDGLAKIEAHLRGIALAESENVSLASLMPVKRLEKFDDFIPEPLLDEANARSRLCIEEARQAATACLSSLPDDQSVTSRRRQSAHSGSAPRQFPT